MFSIRNFKNYIKENFTSDKFEKYFNDLARGKYPVTTNEYLRWFVLSSTLVFTFIYFKVTLFTYVISNSKYDLYEKMLQRDPFLVIPISCKIYINNVKLYGMSFQSFAILLQFISLVRFVILAIRFNIPTSFVMTTISFLASYIWYGELFFSLWQNWQQFTHLMVGKYSVIIGEELRDAWVKYGSKSHSTAGHKIPNFALYLAKIVGNIIHLDFTTDEEYNRWLSEKANVPDYEGKICNMLRYVNAHWAIEQIEGRTRFDDPKSLPALTYGVYLNDPISVTLRYFASLPLLRGTRVLNAVAESYYLLRRTYITAPISFAASSLDQYKALILFGYIVRRGKDYCPYLIRWHWTMQLALHPFAQLYLNRFWTNIGFLLDGKLKPDYENALRSMPASYATMYLFKIQVAQYCRYYFMLIFICFYFYVALHAVCGQYFYIPLFTVNAEIQIDLRNAASVYSGGHTSWQDLDHRLTNTKLWHGVFGRGTNNVPVILTIFDFIKNLFVRFFKFLKR